MPALLAYDAGTVATPIIVALIGAVTVGYQVRNQRSNSHDHGHVVKKLDDLGERVADIHQAVTNHLAHHAHDRRSALRTGADYRPRRSTDRLPNHDYEDITP